MRKMLAIPNYTYSVLCFVLLVQVYACKKQPVQKPGEMLFFKIEAAKNPHALTNDINGTITNKEIVLKIPSGVKVNSLVATFDFVGTGVTVNGTSQQPGASSNNFEQPLQYLVMGNDKVVVPYTVRIETFADEGLNISNIALQKVSNTSLPKDYNFSFNTKGDTAFVLMPPLYGKTFLTNFTTTATTVSINGVAIQNNAGIDFSNPVSINVISASGFKKQIVLKVNWATELPHIIINTTGGAPIISKDDYLTATIKIDGKGIFDNYESTTRIKGRGNSTWSYPKKPYRLKLDNTVSLFGLAPEKDWVLLANYLDWTLMLNAVAMKTGSLINFPYANNMIPVDLTINNQYVGSYAFTEQVETGANRVNVGTNGLLLELDTYFDEPYEFRSAGYNLPVMIKYPELTDQLGVVPVKTTFEQMESLVSATSFPANNYSDYIDVDSLVSYFLVQMLTDNEELNHPKSTYMHKSASGKFIMGPLWDFDWAYGYQGSSGVYYLSSTKPLFWAANTSAGSKFFSRLMADPVVKTKFKQAWTSFKATKLPILQKYIDDYAAFITQSQARDYILWKRGSGSLGIDVGKLKVWLSNRAAYIDGYVAGF